MIYETTPQAELGNFRTRKIFAILPRRISPTQKAWLQKVWVYERYTSYGEHGYGWHEYACALTYEEIWQYRLRVMDLSMPLTKKGLSQAYEELADKFQSIAESSNPAESLKHLQLTDLEKHMLAEAGCV